MGKKPIASCPNPAVFTKWWRNRANRNAEELSDAGKPIRAVNYTVSEEEINRRFKVAPSNFKPGQVLTKLQECGIPCVDLTPGALRLAWNPKQFDKWKETQIKSTHPL
jgi:hypothetical protein